MVAEERIKKRSDLTNLTNKLTMKKNATTTRIGESCLWQKATTLRQRQIVQNILILHLETPKDIATRRGEDTPGTHGSTLNTCTQ